MIQHFTSKELEETVQFTGNVQTCKSNPIVDALEVR